MKFLKNSVILEGAQIFFTLDNLINLSVTIYYYNFTNNNLFYLNISALSLKAKYLVVSFNNKLLLEVFCIYSENVNIY